VPLPPDPKIAKYSRHGLCGGSLRFLRAWLRVVVRSGPSAWRARPAELGPAEGVCQHEWADLITTAVIAIKLLIVTEACRRGEGGGLVFSALGLVERAT